MAAGRQSKVMGVVRVASGNFLEQYDFFVFAYFATAIGRTFFPAADSAHGHYLSLMASLMTFAAAFLVRPVGAIALGAYMDAHGRRAGLLLTLALMAVGTATVALVPGYASIGLLAPLLVVVGRLVQGFSAGVELGGVSVYLSEIATPGHKGFYVSWQSGSQQVAVIVAALLGVALNAVLGDARMQDWGWRIPMVIGCCIIPFLFFVRRSLQETEAFLARKQRLGAGQILRTMLAQWRMVGLGMMMVVMTTVSFYLITANLLWLPLSGALSDRIGRRPLLIATTLAAMLTAYPLLSWLVANPSFGHLLAAELWLSFIYGCYNGAMVVYLTEIMPEAVRTAGFSLAYSLAAVVGGLTPAISEELIHVSGDRAMPGAWMSLAAAVGLGAVLLIGRADAT